MTNLGSRPTLPGRFKWGRLVSLAGAAGLCVSFFMPQIDIYEGPVAVVECLVKFGSLSLLGLSVLGLCVPFLGAILLLPLLAFRAMPRVESVAGVGKFLAWFVCAVCLSVLTTSLAWMTFAVVPSTLRSQSARPLVYALSAVTIATLTLALVAMVRSRLPLKAAAAQFAFGAYCLVYFVLLAIDVPTIYASVWLSIAASGLLVIGAAIDWFQCCPARKGTRDGRP